MRARHVVPLFAVAGLSAFVACSDYDEDSAPAVIDAGPEASTIADTAPPPEVLEAAAPDVVVEAAAPVVEAGTPCDVLYVAPDGDDAATGCEITKAKKTVGGALMLARSTPSVKEIRACIGIYKETRITLDVPVSLRGGYGCSTFKQLPDYGHPVYAANAVTMLESDDAETLVVTGAAVDAKVQIDGFTLRSTNPVAPTTTVLIREKAAPVISNVRVLGLQLTGFLTAKNPSVGLRIASGASPDIDRCAIDGGAGLSTVITPGSVGVEVVAGAGTPHLHDSSIGGGSGQGRFGSVGLLIGTGLSFGGPSAIERNTIVGGSGTGSNTGAVKYASLGVNAAGLKAFDFLDNVVGGGIANCLAGFCIIGAMTYAAEDSAVVHIERNRFFAGDITGPSDLRRFALQGAGGTGTVVDNLVHLGRPTPNMTQAFGITLQNGKDHVVAHNTIAGQSGTGVVQAFIELAPNERGALLFDNLLLGSRSATDVGFLLRNCEGATIAQVRGNMFTGFDVAAFGVRSDCGADIEKITTAAGLETRQNLIVAGSASANRRLAADCTADTSQCAVDSTCAGAYPACIPALVSFDGPTAGALDILGAGWLPKSSSPLCTASAAPDAPDTSKASSGKDVTGKPRTPPLTIGAHQGCQ